MALLNPGRLLRVSGMLLAALLGFTNPAGGESAQEYHVKAAFLANFLTFVSWPRLSQPHEVCVLGHDPFGAVLDETLRRATRGAVPVRRLGIGQSLKGCTVLFVSAGDARRLEGVLQSAAESGVLTVGENDRFLSMGGLMALSADEGRIRVDVDLDAMHRRGFQVSSRLLTVARVRGKNRS